MGLSAARACPALCVLLTLAAACGDDATDAAPPRRADGGQDAALDASSRGVPDVRPDATPEPPRAPLDAGEAGEPEPGDASIPDAGPISDEEPPPEHPVSEYCGDAIRDPALEECDDGPGDDDDSCTPDCRVRTAPVFASDEPVITLGTGAHVAEGGDSGFGLVYVEQAPQETRVWFQGFDARAHPGLAPVELSAGEMAVADANPVLAALPQGRYAVAFTDARSGNPDVLVRVIAADGSGAGDARAAHESSAGFQQDPDILWTGSELIVAFTDLLDVRFRRFDAELAPLGVTEYLGASSGIESMVTLATFAGGWAAAYRSNEDALEHIEVVAHRGDERYTWRTEPAFPGPSGDRPALVALDDDHLLLLFTVSTDPLATGAARVGRLRSAVLSVDSLGVVESGAFAAMREPFSTDETFGQRRPSLGALGGHVYAAWESDAPALGSMATQVFVAPCRWTGALIRERELALPLEAAMHGGERNPRLGRFPLFPDGALLALWEDDPGSTILLDVRPSPFVMLDAPR